MTDQNPARLASFRCTGPAWVIGWAVALYLPSAIFAFAGLSSHARPLGIGFSHLGATTFAVADEIGPAAKLLVGALLAAGWYAIAHLKPRRIIIANAAAGVAAAVLAVLLIPAAYSRGFGIGLSGNRIDLATLPIYTLGGLAAGIIFTLSHHRCARL